jgi:death-on-curing protein
VTKEPAWLSVGAVLAIHDRLIADHGGQPGLRDLGLLESAIAAPRNHFAYEQSDLFSLAASYANAISRDHPFHDGNKRLALTLAAVFLDLNGISLEADEHSAVVQIVALAAGKLSMDDLARWLKANSRLVRRGVKRT